MCRLILAIGTFSSAQILDAAIAMSCGRTATADHDGPSRVHHDGWGAVWRHGDRLAVHRDARPIEDSADASPLRTLSTAVLAVHARYATRGSGVGPEYTHPLQHVHAGRSWYLLHNGTLPTIYQRLGKPRSTFDSAEYLEYLMRDATAPLDLDSTRAKLAAIPPGGTSANAFLITDDCAYVIHWTPEDSPHPRYFTMHRLDTDHATIIASEIVESLAPRDRWRALPARSIEQIPLAS